MVLETGGEVEKRAKELVRMKVTKMRISKHCEDDARTVVGPAKEGGGSIPKARKNPSRVDRLLGKEERSMEKLAWVGGANKRLRHAHVGKKCEVRRTTATGDGFLENQQRSAFTVRHARE